MDAAPAGPRTGVMGVIINPGSGYVGHHGVDDMRSTLLHTAPDARIHVLRKGEDVRSVARGLLKDGASPIVAVGGDGTVSSVAAALVGTDTPLGVIPGGTLNHFARDVGVGHDVEEAVRIVTGGHVMLVDVAQVNDRMFLNNSSIGVYPRMVEIRERYERRLGKWRAAAWAAWLVWRHADPITVTIGDDRRTERRRTYLVFVGNNQYEINSLHPGKRACLDAGELCCYVLDTSGRIGLLRHLFRFFRHTRPGGEVLQSLCTSELTVDPGPSTSVAVSVDGEVARMKTPLHYTVLPRALRVVVPERPPRESRAVRDALDRELGDRATGTGVSA